MLLLSRYAEIAYPETENTSRVIESTLRNTIHPSSEVRVIGDTRVKHRGNAIRRVRFPAIHHLDSLRPKLVGS